MLLSFWREKSERCKDAGSAHIGPIWARLRTPQREALQPPEAGGHCLKGH